MTVDENKVVEIVVKGEAEKKQHAFANALGKIQSAILKEQEQVFLRIEPVSVEVLSAIEHSYTEKFLFFFLPRTRTNYQVELKVAVKITYLDLEAIPFTASSGSTESGLLKMNLGRRKG